VESTAGNCAILLLMEEVAELGVWDAAGRMAAALGNRDLGRLRGLSADEFWERAGHEELTDVAEHAVAVTVLGALGRRTLLDADTPGAEHEHYVIEQQWAGGPESPMVEDQRLFTLADRASIEASGDAERIERMAAKLAAQDAARVYAAALARRDVAAATALWSQVFADSYGAEVLPRMRAVADAALIAAVGPRTLVRVWYEDAPDETVELLWRPDEDGGLRIRGARTFRRPGGR
jgi:hypothetical protein